MAGKKKIDEIELFYNLLEIIRKQNTIIDYLYCMAVQYEAIDEEADMIKDVADELNALGIAEDTTGVQTID